MKTYEQLMTHYWGVIVPMAEAAGIDPWECVLSDGRDFEDHPQFIEGFADYTFALTVLEKVPIFPGMKLYWNRYSETVYTVHQEGLSPSTVFGIIPFDDKFDWSEFSLTPPPKKRTFMLGDKELNSPINKETVFTLSIQDSYGCRFTSYFESSEDSGDAFETFREFMYQARNKE